MIRQTGGTAVGEISTRSSPFERAMVSACGGGMIPSCWPVSSITRISRTRMRSLVRTRSSRLGERSKAIWPPQPSGYRGLGYSRTRVLARDLRDRVAHELSDALRSEVPRRPAAHRHCALRCFPIPRDKHVGDLLQLGLSDLIANLLLPIVQFDPQAGGDQPVVDAPRIVEVTVGNRQYH